jgi:AraC family transcriptional regulator
MKDQQFRNSINEIYTYIEAHLCEEIGIAQLSTIAGYSEYHFQRLFRQYLGISVHQFVRHVRLVTAAKRIVNSDDAITDIALSCGYRTMQSFSREFSKMYHISPMKFRKAGDMRLVSFREEYLRIKPLGEGGLSPRVDDLPAQEFYFVCRKGGSETNSIPAAQSAFGALRVWVHDYQLEGKIRCWLGQMPDEPNITPAAEQRYHAGVIFKGRYQPEAYMLSGVEKGIIPAGKCAIFRAIGPYELLWQTWSAAFRDWLPASRYSLGQASPYEVYVNDPQVVRAEEAITDIYLPLE